jgi:hypothetical protein
MVYDGTVSGLYANIWVPQFVLSTIKTHLDVGDCFLNFILHHELQELAGVDLTYYFGEDGKLLWKAWKRATMGVKSSPYQAVSALTTVADEVIREAHADGANVLKWVRIRLNLPGDQDCNPSLPWVLKVKADGRIAADLFSFVDDLRPTGPGRQECWRAARRAARILNSLGIQDAP